MSEDAQRIIADECDQLKAFLLEKNRRYGNSALEPVRMFSRASPIEQIRVRLDDKMSRIMNGAGEMAEDEDTILDLIGYLVLLRVAMRYEVETVAKQRPRPARRP